MKILVISDSHISPACPNIEDWRKLGEYCVKNKPDCIIHLGDVADLASQAWMKAARGPFTLDEELSAISQHIVAFEEVLEQYRNKCRHDKKAMYRPYKVLCLGNHDVRNDITTVEDIFTGYKWDVYDYLTPVTIDNITFCHEMYKGLTTNSCTTAEELLSNWHGNVVVGHGHSQDYAESFSLATGERIKALKCPVFNPSDTGWAKQTRNKWARGFTEITTFPDREFEFTWRGLECLYETY